MDNACFFEHTEPLKDMDAEFSNNIHCEPLKVCDFQEVKKRHIQLLEDKDHVILVHKLFQEGNDPGILSRLDSLDLYLSSLKSPFVLIE